MGFEVLSENDLSEPLPEVEETGTTYEENALLKAHSGLKVTGIMTVADDSGLSVDYLDGAPGVYSARYSGEGATYESNNNKLLAALDGVPKEKRTAVFVSASSAPLTARWPCVEITITYWAKSSITNRLWKNWKKTA